MNDRFARTPRAPYYAAIMTSHRRDNDPVGYRQAMARMQALAAAVPGYLGMEEAREADGFGILISYWDSEQAILDWKSQGDHAEIRERGRWLWFQHFEMRIARVERAYAGR